MRSKLVLSSLVSINLANIDWLRIPRLRAPPNIGSTGDSSATLLVISFSRLPDALVLMGEHARLELLTLSHLSTLLGAIIEAICNSWVQLLLWNQRRFLWLIVIAIELPSLSLLCGNLIKLWRSRLLLLAHLGSEGLLLLPGLGADFVTVEAAFASALLSEASSAWH